MPTQLQDEVVTLIVADVLEANADSLYAFYQNPPGRKPSDLSKRVSATIRTLDEHAAKELIRHVTDSAIFSMLYLLDSEFRNSAIETRFKKHGGEEFVCEHSLLVEQYRMKVDPGGVVSIGEAP